MNTILTWMELMVVCLHGENQEKNLNQTALKVLYSTEGCFSYSSVHELVLIDAIMNSEVSKGILVARLDTNLQK